MKRTEERFKKIGDLLWLHKEGRTFAIPLKNESKSRKGSGASGTAQSGSLVSPMPGKVLKVLVKNSQNVVKGETVCVIEAMKMEYALKAPFDGTVSKIAKAASDMVQLDEEILHIDKKQE